MSTFFVTYFTYQILPLTPLRLHASCLSPLRNVNSLQFVWYDFSEKGAKSTNNTWKCCTNDNGEGMRMMENNTSPPLKSHFHNSSLLSFRLPKKKKPHKTLQQFSPNHNESNRSHLKLFLPFNLISLEFFALQLRIIICQEEKQLAPEFP